MKNIDDVAKFHKALGEPIRLRIVEHLLARKGCVCICELAKLLGRDQSVIFRHIKLLREAGIVKTDKKAKFLMCCLTDNNHIKKCVEGCL
jgi:DNA-binding transcriptional ArsR family regulator